MPNPYIFGTHEVREVLKTMQPRIEQLEKQANKKQKHSASEKAIAHQQ